MERIVIVGRGGAGKSTLARRLGSVTLEPRLEAADTVIVPDFSLLRCVWRSIRRSREDTNFWRCVIGYRRRSLPALMATIGRRAPGAHVHLLRTPQAAEALLAAISMGQTQGDHVRTGRQHGRWSRQLLLMSHRRH